MRTGGLERERPCGGLRVARPFPGLEPRGAGRPRDSRAGEAPLSYGLISSTMPEPMPPDTSCRTGPRPESPRPGGEAILAAEAVQQVCGPLAAAGYSLKCRADVAMAAPPGCVVPVSGCVENYAGVRTAPYLLLKKRLLFPLAVAGINAKMTWQLPAARCSSAVQVPSRRGGGRPVAPALKSVPQVLFSP